VIAVSKKHGMTAVERDLTASETQEKMFRLRGTLVEQLARRRASTAVAAFAALLGKMSV
jgi:phage I-like protein